MQIVNLYRYVEANQTVVTPHATSESDTPSGYRLIADDGKILKNGDILTYCVDVGSADGWKEIDDTTDQTEEERAVQLEKDSAVLKILLGEGE